MKRPLKHPMKHLLPGIAVAVIGPLSVLVPLSGCGSGHPRRPPVADLPATDAGSAPAGGTAASGPRSPAPGTADRSRPQLRLDSSEAEVNAVWNAYNSCLKAHGHRMLTGRGPNSPDMEDTSAASKAARTACANRLPLQPPELDPALNPRFDEQYRAYIACLKGRGMKIHATEPLGSGWTYDDSGPQALTADQQARADRECQLDAFGGGGK